MNTKAIVGTLFFLTFTCSKVLAHLPLAGTYNVDLGRSSVTFKIRNFASMVNGKFDSFSGTIEIGDTLENCKVTGTVDTKSINTNIGMRDKHLRSKTFFEVNNYPVMTFKSGRITGASDSFQMVGDLKIKDETRQVTFSCKYIHGETEQSLGSFSAEAKINRKDFGIKSFFTASKEVTILLKIYLEPLR